MIQIFVSDHIRYNASIVPLPVLSSFIHFLVDC